MSAAVKPAPSNTRCYQRRRPEHTLCYRTVQTYFETWLALAAGPGDPSPPTYVEQAIAALVPPPRTHRHRYDGVLAPNAPLRAAVTALAPVRAPPPPPPDPTGAQEAPRHRTAARYRWAMALARIYAAFPLTCPNCQAEMRLIAFINAASTVRQILAHLGESARPPRIAPARGPPRWGAAAASPPAGNDPHWELAAQPLPESAFDQRLAC